MGVTKCRAAVNLAIPVICSRYCLRNEKLNEQASQQDELAVLSNSLKTGRVTVLAEAAAIAHNEPTCTP